MTFDNAHLGWFTNNRNRGFDLALFQFAHQCQCTKTAAFLIMSKGKMYRLLQFLTGIKWSHCQSCRDKAFHITRAATIEPPVAGLHFKWVAGPGLVGYRHHIGMPR